MNPTFFAHSLPEAEKAAWQGLQEHLLSVARSAARFADAFRAAEWGYAAGLWHDLGKFSEAFQRYLDQAGADYHADEVGDGGRPRRGSVDHTSAGAQHAAKEVEVFGHLLAYAIAGHHAGLLDAIAEGASLDARLKKAVEPWEHGLAALPEPPAPALPPYLARRLKERGTDPQGVAFSFAFFTRMVFSCLVDADFLDTEAFLDPGRAGARSPWGDDVLARMEETLEAFVASLPSEDTAVNRERRRVRRACLRCAQEPPGLFSLTVPTGGGKTLSSLAFALRHAQLHGLRRIVYVIPFTSIIEQNAAVFRRVFEPLMEQDLPDPVLEHHSALDAGRETLANRLAAENWDAPLVVTTSVQFYESLFSHRPGRCRKLHNLARAVIILDEAQKIPVEHLEPCLRALEELASGYGASVVLCTATQPAVHRRPDFPIGLAGVREIVPDPEALYRALKRVDVVHLGGLEDAELTERLAEHQQVLCIVNTRRHARTLFERLEASHGRGAAIHLSAAMCPEHRAAVLEDVRRRLGDGETCRVISTQLVEAGVDVDFPVVYRSLAGLDSIAQAAGRCNRNGRLDTGVTYVFQSEHPRSEAFLRDTVNASVQLLGGDGHEPLYDHLLSLEAVERYFRLYYWEHQDGWDRTRILDAFHLVGQSRDLPFQFNFRTVGQKFRLIEDSGESVLVPWGERGERLCRQLRNQPPPHPRELLRALQRFTVQVPRRLYQRHLGGALQLVHDRYPVLVSPELHYDRRLGLVLDREEFEAETFIT